jgi:hypothetical protein
MCSYTTAGLPTKKELRPSYGPTLDAVYTYDNEGKLVSTQYPNSGPTLTYTFDAMSRPIKLTDNQPTPVDWAKDVVYNAAGQMTQMSYTLNTGGTAYRTETRQYNALGQMTQLLAPGLLGYQYTYSATQNNGIRPANAGMRGWAHMQVKRVDGRSGVDGHPCREPAVGQ